MHCRKRQAPHFRLFQKEPLISNFCRPSFSQSSFLNDATSKRSSTGSLFSGCRLLATLRWTRRQSDEMGYAPGIVETELADEETKWAGIPPDPYSHAILNRSLLSPAWYDDFLAR